MDLGKPTAKAELRLVSAEVVDSDMIINSEGSAGKYGKVFVTWSLEATEHNSSGRFTGTSHCYMEDGAFITASLQGIWRRKGHKIQLHSLDLGSNGDRNFAKLKADLVKRTVTGRLFAL